MCSFYPLPEEQLGAGARWVVEGPNSAGGMSTSRRTEYRLDAWNGTTGEVHVEGSSDAGDQDVEVLGVDERAHVVSSSKRVTATVNLAVAHLFGGGEFRKSSKVVARIKGAEPHETLTESRATLRPAH